MAKFASRWALKLDKEKILLNYLQKKSELPARIPEHLTDVCLLNLPMLLLAENLQFYQQLRRLSLQARSECS